MIYIDRLREIVERVEQYTEPHPDMIAVPLDVLRGVIEYVKALEAIKDKAHPRPAGYEP